MQLRRSARSAIATLIGLLMLLGSSAAISQTDTNIPALERGKPIQRELAGGQSHTYRLDLAAGQFCQIVVDQRGVDVVVELFAPDGKKLIEVDGPNDRNGPEQLSLVADAAASYRLHVRSPDKTEPAGRYEVKIKELRTATEQDNTRIAAERAFGEGIQLEIQQTAETQRRAIEKYQESLPLWQLVGDTVQEVTTLSSIGRSYISLGEHPKALAFYEKGLQLSQSIGNKTLEALMLDRIATVHEGLGEKQKALSFHDRSLQLRRAGDDIDAVAASLNNIGLSYATVGESQKALDFLSEALPIYRKLNNRKAEATTLNNIGLTYGNLGEYQKSLDFFAQALPLHRAANNRQMEATTFNNMGVVTRRSGDRKKALELFSQALPIYKSLGNIRDQGMTLANIGMTYNELGEYQKALDFLGQALAIHRSVGNRRAEAISLNNTGLAYAKTGAREKALEHYIQALELSRAIGERHGEAATLYHMARLERERGNLAEARNRIEESFRAVESLRADVTSQQLRASYFASVREYHDFYIDLLMGLHKERPSEGFDALALEASEKGRARSLLELLKESRASIQLGVDPALIERERTLRQMISDRAERQVRLLSGKHTDEQAKAASREINNLATEYDQLQARIRQMSPQYAGVTKPTPLGLKDIQKELLDDETLLLEYALGVEKCFLWAVTSNSIQSFELPGRAEIEAASRRVYDAVTARNQVVSKETPQQRLQRVGTADAEYRKASTELSRMLLAPVASRLARPRQQATKRLVIVSDGILQYVPFGALPMPDRALVEFTPLIVEHEVVSLPSASVIALLRKETAGRATAARTVAILADPVFDPRDPRIGQADKDRARTCTRASDG